MIRKALFILCLLSTVKLPTATAATKHLILIKATRLLDTRTGTVLSDQEILIEGDKIAQVGSPSVIGRQAPGSIKVIDLTGLTVLPGLVDCHARRNPELKLLQKSRSAHLFRINAVAKSAIPTS